jgi:predicted RNase H-like HicB family nuclease
MRPFLIIRIREANVMKAYDYTAVVWKETVGYVSKCPELGVASCGDSFEEAVSNLREAVDLYLENAHHRHPPHR